MIEIPLEGPKGRGKKAKIDDEDAELVKGSWYYNQGYAVRSSGPHGQDRMHRLIAKCADKHKVVDHINGDRLDNRRENLRIVSRFENWKHKTQRHQPTEHEGIFWDRYKERYIVVLYEDPNKLYGGRIDAGAYPTVEQAIKVRNAMITSGDFYTTRGPRSWDKLQQTEPSRQP